MANGCPARKPHGVYIAPRMNLLAIVFDFDGTLVDASEAICSSFNAVLLDHGFPLLETDVIKTKIGRPLKELFAEVDHAANDDVLQSYVEEYRKHFFPISAAKTRPMPGVVEALDEIGRGRKLAIATSRKADGAEHILRSLGLAHHVGAVVGLEDVTCVKPDPEPVLRALSRIGVEPARAMMVGDTEDDVVAGLRAGTRSVGVTTGAFSAQQLSRAGAHHVVTGMKQLAELLRG
jgi:HAD superfamily hydrolase (TIGR01509 family)